MSSNNQRWFSDGEWKEIREGWAENSKAARKVLKLVQRDYKPGSAKHERIGAVMEREKLEIELILVLIDKIRDVDDALHGTHSPP